MRVVGACWRDTWSLALNMDKWGLLMAQLELLPEPMLPSPGSRLLLGGEKEMICKCVC